MTVTLGKVLSVEQRMISMTDQVRVYDSMGQSNDAVLSVQQQTIEGWPTGEKGAVFFLVLFQK